MSQGLGGVPDLSDAKLGDLDDIFNEVLGSSDDERAREEAREGAADAEHAGSDAKESSEDEDVDFDALYASAVGGTAPSDTTGSSTDQVGTPSARLSYTPTPVSFELLRSVGITEDMYNSFDLDTKQFIQRMSNIHHGDRNKPSLVAFV